MERRALSEQYSPSKKHCNSEDIKITFLFEKRYEYHKNHSDWKLPPIERLFKDFYQFESLQNLKIRLNGVKSKLDYYDLAEWSSHTRRRDPTNEIPWSLKNDINAEFVTIAWCKMYECLHQYSLVNQSKLNSLHLCEAPGAFIAALNHYLYSTFDENEVQWKWLATTLNPYYEGNPLNKMIIDDRFMFHTLDNWLFHEDFTGNIIHKKNIESIVEQCIARFNNEDIHLITADGSVDCKENPDEQEDFVSTLHFAEICTALSVLGENGNFVIKMFTLFEASSVSKLYLLNCLFRQVSVFKPATSKIGNSEVYVICLGFMKSKVGQLPKLLELMINMLVTENTCPIFQKADIPDDFRMQHEVCCRLFLIYQENAIESNIKSYENYSRNDAPYFQSLRTDVRKEFLKRYAIKPLAEEKTILFSYKGNIYKNCVPKRLVKGSFSEREQLKNVTKEEEIFNLRTTLNELEKSVPCFYGVIADWTHNIAKQISLQIYRGKPVQILHSSLFILTNILEARDSIKKIFAIDPLWSGTSCKFDNGFKKNCLDSSKYDFSQIQRDFLTKILQAIIDRHPQYITFKNYMFLSHFSASFLRYLSGNIFDKCCIKSNPDFEITLEKCDYNKNIIDLLKTLENAIKTDENILCLVEIKKLHKNYFHEAVTIYNNQLLLNNFKLILGNEL